MPNLHNKSQLLSIAYLIARPSLPKSPLLIALRIEKESHYSHCGKHNYDMWKSWNLCFLSPEAVDSFSPVSISVVNIYVG